MKDHKTPQPGGSATSRGAEGQIIDGRFEILEFLGQGSQGTTFRGIDRRTGQAVAIK